MPRLACLLLLWAAVQAGAAETDADTVFRPFEADYQLTRNGISVGHTRIRFELGDQGDYRYYVESGPNMVLSLFRNDQVEEQSEGRLVRGWPLPLDYLYRRSGEADRELSLKFDWDSDRVDIQSAGSRWRLAVPSDTLDKLIQQLALSAELAAGKREPQFRVADGGLLKTYRYQVVGREDTEVPMGRFETLMVKRYKDDNPSDYTLWIAPSLGWQPVKILRRYRGTSYQMELESLAVD